MRNRRRIEVESNLETSATKVSRDEDILTGFGESKSKKQHWYILNQPNDL